VTMIAPDDLKDSEEVVFEFRVTPMNNETPFADEYVQKFSFPYMTECSGATCLVQELINPEPQTIAFYVLIVALLFYARGRTGRAPDAYDKDDFPELGEDAVAYNEFEDEDDLPAPVLAQDDVDDDLELLEELDDL